MKTDDAHDTLPPPCNPARCACGRTFTAEAWWALTPPRDRVEGNARIRGDRWDLGPGEPALNLRNCPCGSTLAQVEAPSEHHAPEESGISLLQENRHLSE